MGPGGAAWLGTPSGRIPEPARATRRRSMAAPMAPITWCDRRTMQPFSRCGRMLVESDPQERGLCGIGLGRGRMRAALGGNLGHRLGGWRGTWRILYVNLGTPVE